MNYDLRVADCITAMNAMAKDSVDLVVTSPPYNLGIEYPDYNDLRPEVDYLRWCRKWAQAVYRVLKPDGSFFLNIGGTPTKQLLQLKVIMALEKVFYVQNTFHWVKAISVQPTESDVISVGHFKPINSKRFVNDCHEYVVHFTKTANVPIDRLALGVPYVDKSNVKRWDHTGGQDLRCRGNTWYIAYPTIQRRKDRPHPATFPPELACNCILIHGLKRVQTMLDPFVGIGNSALAAKRLKIPNFYGFDLTPSYIEDALDLLREPESA